MHGLKLFLSSNVASQRKRPRDRTLTLLIYGLILSTVATTAANAAEKITNFKDQRNSQIGAAKGPVLNLNVTSRSPPLIHERLSTVWSLKMCNKAHTIWWESFDLKYFIMEVCMVSQRSLANSKHKKILFYFFSFFSLISPLTTFPLTFQASANKSSYYIFSAQTLTLTVIWLYCKSTSI